MYIYSDMVVTEIPSFSWFYCCCCLGFFTFLLTNLVIELSWTVNSSAVRITTHKHEASECLWIDPSWLFLIPTSVPNWLTKAMVYTILSVEWCI